VGKVSIEKKYREEDSLMNKQFTGLRELYWKQIKEIDRESQFAIEKEAHSVPSKIFEQNLSSEGNTEQYVELENFSEEFYRENLLKLEKEGGNSLDEKLRKIVRRLNSEEKKSKKPNHQCNVMNSQIKKSQFILKI